MRAGLRGGWAQLAVQNPIAFFFAFRFLAWVLAVVILVTRSAPEVNLRFGTGLALFTLFQLSLGTFYAVVLHPRLARASGGLTWLKPPNDLLAAGVADMAPSLVVVFFSGGWGSPFWHFAVTSILVPCLLVGFRRAMVITTAFVGGYVATVVLGGDGLDGTWLDTERNFFIGFLFTAYMVGIAVSYLGTIFRALEAQRVRTGTALDDLETLFQVTRNVVHGPADPALLVQRVTQTVRDGRHYELCAVYLCRPGERKLELAASTAGVEELDGGPVVEFGHGLVGRAASQASTQTASPNGGPWRAALPLRGGEDILGVMLVVSRSSVEDSARAQSLAEALANQVAVGIQNAYLSQKQVELAAQEERSRIAREIHDGIAQAIYVLSLNLETCADLAERVRGPLRQRLQTLVPLAKQTLLETRHYIYDLKPLLSGEQGLVTMAENQVKEFRAVASIPARLCVQGESRRVPAAVAACLYRLLQEALANVLKHARAGDVKVELSFEPSQVRLSVQDDGVGFDVDQAGPGYGLGNMRQRAQELGGGCEIVSAAGKGARVAATLPAKEVESEAH